MTETSQMGTQSGGPVQYSPVTTERLPDLAPFSAAHGKFRHCSCMRWRMTSADFRRATVADRVAALDALVHQGVPVGVLALADEMPVAWCSVAPRQTYAALARYRALSLTEDANVSSVICFFLDTEWRRQGLTLALLTVATSYAHSQGTTIVEGYSVASNSHRYRYMGAPAVFVQAGFREASRASNNRRVMRHDA